MFSSYPHIFLVRNDWKINNNKLTSIQGLWSDPVWKTSWVTGHTIHSSYLPLHTLVKVFDLVHKIYGHSTDEERKHQEFWPWNYRPESIFIWVIKYGQLFQDSLRTSFTQKQSITMSQLPYWSTPDFLSIFMLSTIWLLNNEHLDYLAN